MRQIVTVTGPIDPTEAGFTLSHEHVFWDYWNLIMSYDCIFEEESVAIKELRAFAEAGGGTLVDCTTIDIGRNPQALRRVSEAVGINVVMGTGWYREKVYPPYVFELDSNKLADILVREITEGAEGSGIRPGFIGEIGTERGRITPAQERVFRAAARAQRRTGVSIWTHTTHFGELALEQIAILQDEGVPPDRITISHLGDRYEFDKLRAIAETGVFLSIDNIGYRGDGYPDDSVRADNVLRLTREGFVSQVMLGTDIGQKSALASYGGRGYGHMHANFIPRLKKLGVSVEHIHQMTVTNPARALAYEFPEPPRSTIARR